MLVSITIAWALYATATALGLLTLYFFGSVLENLQRGDRLDAAINLWFGLLLVGAVILSAVYGTKEIFSLF